MTLTVKEENDIIDEEVDLMYEEENEMVENIADDGGLPGDLLFPGPERLDRYWLVTKDLSDLQLLIDPNSEEFIRRNLIRPPVNPYWLNQLSIPGEFTKKAKDFMALNARYADRYTA